MKKKSDFWNLFFSAFLLTAFLLCSYFFVGIIGDMAAQNIEKQRVLTALMYALLGAMLFYATRVGDGKQVWRFSLITLLLMVLPAFYVVLASAIAGLPLHEQIASRSEIVGMAGAIFGYGVPYTFLSGYELDRSQAESQPQTPAEEETPSEQAELPSAEQEDLPDEDETPAAAENPLDEEPSEAFVPDEEAAAADDDSEE